ncbi:alpha/beta hydrolase [Lysinibacter sp. HNR]|uniref:alpha/beta fold hydrolase n=1 Tax=Lysinibacter sp. HNR TaxID=3031408 RepID=UPI002434D486|nr:alpha/beta hydrolase [Lysinibacter sp. HNR]WGD36898.1 alpha/beta hydrolase [Lysinibacter sp. HNR]
MAQSPQEPTEFSFLAEDAERYGVTHLPAVTRVTGAEGRVSALLYGRVKPRVTFLHGAGLNAHTFDPTILILEEPALSIDLPGHGDSEWRADADYRPQTIADDVALMIAERTDPHTPQVLVGHSLGGLVATVIAANRPELITALVLVDITPGLTPESGSEAVREFIAGKESFASRDEIVDRAIAFGIGHNREVLARGVFLNTRRRTDGRFEFKHHLARLAALTEVEPSESSSAFSQKYSALWETLSSIRIPLTLIRASNGFISEEAAKEWRTRLPESRIITLTAGHNIQEHAPAELAAAIRTTLTE